MLLNWTHTNMQLSHTHWNKHQSWFNRVIVYKMTSFFVYVKVVLTASGRMSLLRVKSPLQQESFITGDRAASPSPSSFRCSRRRGFSLCCVEERKVLSEAFRWNHTTAWMQDRWKILDFFIGYYQLVIHTTHTTTIAATRLVFRREDVVKHHYRLLWKM